MKNENLELAIFVLIVLMISLGILESIILGILERFGA